MPLFEQDFLPPGKYRIGESLRDFTAADFKEYRDGTAAALKAGVPIPLLESHAPAGVEDGYPKSETDKDSALKCRGWLRDIKQRKDGTLAHVLDVTDDATLKGLKDGSIRFTSPEFREKYTDGSGRSFGRMIRHIALTPKPRASKQGAFIPVSQFGECLQFSDDDLEKPADDTAPKEEPKPDPVNPDLPKTSGQDKMREAINACLAELGVVLADAVDISTDEGMVALLSALKTAAESKRKAEQEKDADDDGSGGGIKEETNQNLGSQFSERELALIAERDGARQALAAQARTAHEAKVKAAFAGLPPKLKSELESRFTSAQFSDDGGEKPGLTVLEVAELVKAALPKNLQFDESNLKEESDPAHDTEVTPEVAEAYARQIHGAGRTQQPVDIVVRQMYGGKA